MTLTMSASQTVGPFFQIGLSWAYRSDLFAGEHERPRLSVAGVLRDADALPIGDAVLELWQADADARFSASTDAPRGYGRVPTDAAGRFQFTTIAPGAVVGPGDVAMAPHVSVLIFMRGLLKPVKTRMYFPDARDLASCPILQLVPAARRATLIAQPAGPLSLRWDVRMQGPDETVFFEY
jgi:protocatechuate 3,4-dioxygenase, alpha subunit